MPASTSPSHLGHAGKYELLLELAAGGMATVFVGIGPEADAPLVAIKRTHKHLASDQIYLSMLHDEARLAAAIDHANVVKVRELGFESGEPFIVLDYVEGAALSDIIHKLNDVGRTLPPRIALRIVLDALAGLQAAHVLCDESGRHLGIIHRDVSPHNVMVDYRGVAKLTDFGIAKAHDRVQITRTHEVKGKLAYLAPERVDSQRLCTAQSDVFSMAVVLWEAMAGRRLFNSDDAVQTLQEVLSAPIPLLKKVGISISPELDAALARGLARDLSERPKSAAEFAEELERAAEGDVATAEEVAQLVEMVFGSQLRDRHASFRSALGTRDADKVFGASGIPARDETAAPLSEKKLEDIAPCAPSGDRYAFSVSNGAEATARRTIPKSWLVGSMAAAAGLALAVGVAMLWRWSRGEPTTTTIPPTLATSLSSPAIGPTSRKVVVVLPVVARSVTIDDKDHPLDPPAQSLSIEFAREAPTRHRVEAVTLDGTRAVGEVEEADGFTRAVAPGFDLYMPPQQPHARSTTRAMRPLAGPQPVGTTRNGFTKLK